MSLYGMKQLIESARTVRKNTILIAEDIPERDYDHRPAPGSRSVAETLTHIALLTRGTRWLHEEARVRLFDADVVEELLKRTDGQEKAPRSKAQIVELLRFEGERWFEWLEGLSDELLSEQVSFPGGPSKNRFEMLLGAKEHEMHHRGQLTVIERLLGIVPHLSRNRRAVSKEAAPRT